MKNFNSILLLTGTLFVLLMSSCAKVYQSPDALNLARKHRIMGVSIPTVSIPPQKKMTAQELADLAVKESETFHYEMVSWLLKRKNEGKITVNVLDASTSLAKIHNSTVEGKRLTPKEIAEILDVDALLVSNYKLTKPMSTGAAIVTNVLFGFGSTNEVVVSMELYDRSTDKMIWNFSHNISGGLFSSSDQLVNEVMRIASKKLPYSKLKK